MEILVSGLSFNDARSCPGNTCWPGINFDGPSCPRLVCGCVCNVECGVLCSCFGNPNGYRIPLQSKSNDRN